MTWFEAVFAPFPSDQVNQFNIAPNYFDTNADWDQCIIKAHNIFIAE
jgi:hypothetical protein